MLPNPEGRNGGDGGGGGGAEEDGPSTSDDASWPLMQQQQQKRKRQQEQEETYFREYADWSVHELMLKDAARTGAYGDAIQRNAHLFRGKVVMDVGCGTGILALFCARAGAERVVGVEAASDVASLARRIVEKNGFESVVEIVNEKVEDVQDMDDLTVDIIVSEWMGFYLLHESMLDAVIYARDKWLRPSSGLLFPSLAYMFMSPVDLSSLHAEKCLSWSNFYGFDFSPVASVVTASRAAAPTVDVHLEESQLLAEPKIIASFDLRTVDREEVASVFETLEFVVEGSPTTTTTTTRPFHGFAVWFDCVFATGLPAPAQPVTLSTRPGAPSTHWKQTILWLPEAAVVAEDDVIGCHVTLTRSEDNPRHYDICVDLRENDEDEDEDDDGALDFEGKDHPVPCDCGAARCLLVKTMLERYAEEEAERIEAERQLRD